MIMLDGMWLSVRRDTASKEVVLFVLDQDKEERREIPDFEVNLLQDTGNWSEVIKRVYE